MRTFRYIVITLGLLSARLGAEGLSDNALKQQIVAQAHSINTNDYSFTRTSRIEEIGIGKAEKRVIVERWDPRKPADTRWSLVTVDGQPPAATDAKTYDAASSSRKVPSYSKVAEYFAGGTRASSPASPGKVTFHFASLPKGIVVLAGTELSASATGEAIVNTDSAVPFVEQVRFTMAQPTRIKLIARLDRFEGTTRYRLMPDGKPFLADQTIEMTGSMIGQQGSIHTSITYSDVAPVAH